MKQKHIDMCYQNIITLSLNQFTELNNIANYSKYLMFRRKQMKNRGKI